jgi:hypothetical protein
MSSGVGSDTAEPELTGGALAFAIIMGVAITVCITVSCWTCYKKREQARLDLEEDSNAAIEAYYGEANVTSIGSPPPPPLTAVVPQQSRGTPLALPQLEVKADEPAAETRSSKDKKKRNGRSKGRDKKSKRRNSSSGRSKSKSRDKKERRKKSVKPEKKKIQWAASTESQQIFDEEPDDTADVVETNAKTEMTVANEKSTTEAVDAGDGMVGNATNGTESAVTVNAVAAIEDDEGYAAKKSRKKKKSKKEKKKKKTRKKKKKKKKKAQRYSTGEEEEEDPQDPTDPTDPEEQQTGQSLHPPPNRPPPNRPPPSHRPGGAMLSSAHTSATIDQEQSRNTQEQSLSDKLALLQKLAPTPGLEVGGKKEEEEEAETETETESEHTAINVAAVDGAAESTAPEPDERLRRWSLSWQFTAGPFEEDDDIHGPVKLHYMNKVCSVGRGDGLQMQIKGDDSIEEEHGMISYRNDELLYVNSSGALTTIDGVGISSEQGPVVFKNGSSLTIGATTLVVSSYMEFADE